ncbi:STMN1 [Cervus elaphus hippelaphus]|uniref:STMN1 n=1 Tax=Cervus elaphus hippelaphus TaxID=46360 RepID=A0A212D3Y7_CEREH|nr:STMN1 [Cervus elaphus hippelaphus]
MTVPAPPAHIWRHPRPKAAFTPGIVRLSHQPELHFPRCSGVPRGGVHLGCGEGGEGSARAAAPSQCGARRGGHVPLFGAFVRARVCWCSECGQAARTEQDKHIEEVRKNKESKDPADETEAD